MDVVRHGDYKYSNQNGENLVALIQASTYTACGEWNVCEHEIGDFPRMGEYKIDKHGAMVFEIKDKLEILSYKNNTWSWEPITHITWHTGAKCVRCVIGHRILETTANESIAVFDYKSGDLVKVSPLSCTAESLIPVFKKDPMPFGTNGTREEGWFLGSMISDGWVSDWYIGYCKMDPYTRGYMKEILSRRFGEHKVVEIEGKPSHNKLAHSKALHVTGVVAEAFGHSLNMYAPVETRTGKAALYKWIDRRRITTASEEFLWGLFCGLMDGDGSIPFNVSHHGVSIAPRFATSSPYLLEDFKYLCYKLGIRFSVTVSPARNWSAEAYTICMSSADFCSKLDKMEFHGERTCQIHDILTLEGTSPRDYIDVIPLTKHEQKLLHISCNYMRRSDLCRLLDHRNKPDLGKLCARVADKNTTWYPIKSIEAIGDQEVYDFIVPTTKVFAVNDGVVVYDTASSNGILSKQANEEVTSYLNSVGRYIHSNGKLMHGTTDLIKLTIFNLSRDPSVK